ncbi:hypothetical protein ACRAWC_24805 [Leifsonia sp. L25]|uniref:hypothetical protein n=1 Tax=Leifsonia sp. L25 TaxID=3423957 RepID=UPI003D696D0A
MDAAHDAGIDYCSTPPNAVRSAPGQGATETIIGNWFAQGGRRRVRTVLATKL